ncbi:Caspase domain containing protein [Lactarius tabidus]
MATFLIQYFGLVSIWFLYIINLSKRIHPSERIQLTSVEEDTQSVARAGPTTKRRALLVGISYHHSPSDIWPPLDGPHEDVNRFRELLIGTYGYTPDDITVLKDDPELPDILQPTSANLTSELIRLVLDAAPGDKFIFFYSGYSDQQNVLDDTSEGGFDEGRLLFVVELFCSINRIVLQAVFDAFDSGTLLDLPHHHCNSVYVPWQSKGERRTLTKQNINVRHQAVGLSGLHGNPFALIADVVTRDNVQLLTDPFPSPHPLLQIDTQVLAETTDDGQPNRRRTSIGESEIHPVGEGGHSGSHAILSPTRCDSPVSYVRCDGWCGYDPFESRFAVSLSLSACSGPQRAWDSPHRSLATVLCRYLGKHAPSNNPRPSYRSLMTHVNFVLHENTLDLHKYTRQQKKKGIDFDGEMDNFQQPKLSSLTKLVGLCYFWLKLTLICIVFMRLIQNMDDILDL